MKNIYTRLDPSSTINDIKRLIADIGEMAVDMGSTQVNRREPGDCQLCPHAEDRQTSWQPIVSGL